MKDKDKSQQNGNRGSRGNNLPVSVASADTKKRGAIYGITGFHTKKEFDKLAKVFDFGFKEGTKQERQRIINRLCKKCAKRFGFNQIV